MTKVADYIAQFLLDQGVTDIFMLTGSGAMYLNDAIARSGMKFYCARNEATAPMMAEAYARVKGTLGAACVTSGPGSTNAVPGLAEAWVDSAPIIVLSGQVERRHTTHNARLPGIRTFGTAEINIIPIVKPLTKYAAMVDEATSIRYHLEKAVHLATTGRPGPVWLDIPMDIESVEIDPDRIERYTPPVEPSQSEDLDAQVEALVERLAKSERPVLIAGHGVRLARAEPEFRELVHVLDTPVLFSRFGCDMLPYSHRNNFGLAGLKGTRYCAWIMKNADVVVSVGCRLAVQLVGHRFDAFAPDAWVAMVDIEPDEMRKPGVPVSLPICADAKVLMRKLIQRLSRDRLPSWKEWLQACQEVKDRYPMALPKQRRNPIDLYYFMSRLDALSDEHHIFITDAGSNYYVGGQVFRFEKGQRVVSSVTFAAMGLSIPLAIGASVADPTAQVLAVTGDGSLELNVQELKTMSHYGVNVKLFVINNGGYLSMRNWQDSFFEGRRIDTPEITGAGTLNLEGVARAFDLDYALIYQYEEIDQKLRAVMADDRPIFVEVVCDDQQKIVAPIKDLSYQREP